jgi:MFS family permease
MRAEARTSVVAALGTTQTLAWASSYYLPALLAVPIARDLGIAPAAVFAAFSLALVVSAFVGPASGRAIDRHGGRPVLMGTSVLFAAGLGALGAANGTAGLFAAWALLGVAMGSGLYEAAFATLVRLYGQEARSPITGITLMAGFASTVGWPLSAWLEARYGWRGACFGWAALHLLLGLPLNASLPAVDRAAAKAVAPASGAPQGNAAEAMPWRAAALLAFVFAATWFISTAMAAHLPRLLQAGGATLAAAVAAGALIGPAQVCARLLEYSLLRRVHPLLTARLAAVAHPLGVAVLLVFGAPAAPLFALLHGAGNGILTIAKGTLPLGLFGAGGYGARQGWLMVPARVAQAAAPFAFGLALDRWGVGALWWSAGIALAGLAALLALRQAGTPPAPADRVSPAAGE